MKASKLIFKGSRSYGGRDVSVIETVDNQISDRADSIETDGVWVVVTRGDFVRAWPMCDVLELTPVAVEPKRAGK